MKNMFYIRNGKEVSDTNVAGGNPAFHTEFVAPVWPYILRRGNASSLMVEQPVEFRVGSVRVQK